MNGRFTKLTVAPDQRWQAYRRGRLLLWPLAPFFLAARGIAAYNDRSLGHDDNAPRVHPTGVRCAVVPWALAGSYRKMQPDLLSSVGCKIRWRGCTAWGEITMTGDDGVMWVPGRQATDWGARRFLIRNDDASSAVFSRVGLGRTGVVVRSPVGDELRLVVRTRDERVASELLAGHGR